MNTLEFIFHSKWSYFAYFLPLLIGITFFYWRNKNGIFYSTKTFVSWAKNSMETGGQASAEKMTAFTILNLAYIPSRLKFAWTVIDPLHLLWAMLLDTVFILILFRIITPKDMIELKAGYGYREKTETKTEITKTEGTTE